MSALLHVRVNELRRRRLVTDRLDELAMLDTLRMKMRHLGSLLATLLAMGCEKSPDPNELMAKMSAVNDRTCACKDQACIGAAERDFEALQPEMNKVKKDRDLNSKFAALITAHNACVVNSMKAQGHQ